MWKVRFHRQQRLLWRSAASNELIWMCIFGVGARQLGEPAISGVGEGM